VRRAPARLRRRARRGRPRRGRPGARRGLEAPVAAPLAAAAAAVVAQALEPPPGAAALVPVPPDPERVLERAHHPAEALARELGARWDLPLQPLLTRRHARPQRGLSRVERRRNVATVRAGNTRAPPRVVLVDDVYTTGATVSAAASALRRAGAREVHVITFSRASRGGGFG
jgi:predicted amidophosphoribosyltransferase